MPISPPPPRLLYISKEGLQIVPPFPSRSYFQSHSDVLPPQDRNIILTQAFEYRFALSPSSDDTAQPTEPTSRYLGQVVVPGPHISKIELDEFASQVRGFTPARASAKGAVAAEQDPGTSASASTSKSEKGV